MGIKYRADSGFHKFSAFNQLNLLPTVNCFEIPHVSYPERFGAFKTN